MQQQLPPPRRLMVLTVSVRVLADMRVQQPSFISGHFRKAVLELDFTVLRCLHLGPGEGETRLVSLQQVVIMPGLAVVAQDFDSRLHGSPAFILNARKAHCVKRLCGAVSSYVSYSAASF